MDDLEIGTTVTPLAPKAKAKKPAQPLEVDGTSALALEDVPVLEGTIEPEALATVEPDQRLAVFSTPGGLRPILDVITRAARAHTADVSTQKGRDAVRSLAFQIAKCKTRLDDAGKELVDDLKALPKTIDANRKAMRDELDALRDEKRQPLTDWEAGQARQQAFITKIIDTPAALAGATVENLEAALQALEDLPLTDAPDFPKEAQTAKAAAMQEVLQLLAKRIKEDADAAELARLREQEAQHQREEAERRRALEVAEQAQRNAQAELEAAGRREQEAKDALARAVREKEESEERERQAEQRRCREREDAAAAAIDAERARAEKETEAKRQDDERKANDVEHRRAFNREALADLVTAIHACSAAVPNEEEAAKAVLIAVFNGKVRHIEIKY